MRLFTSRACLMAFLLTGQLHAATSITTPALSLPQACSYEVDVREMVLDNGLRALLVSDPDLEESSVAMVVQAGSKDDPRYALGLAHFLEHMLFLGSDKYPGAHEYASYLSRYGGRSNATTAYNITNYFFTVRPEGLEGALDRFASQFVAPRFDVKYVEQERLAVHAEYEYRKDHSGWRISDSLNMALAGDQADQAKPGDLHPMLRFSIGNQKTLGHMSAEALSDLLQKWWALKYHASGMRLVVRSSQSIESLQRAVEDRFAAIPSRKDFKSYFPPALDVSPAVPGFVRTSVSPNAYDMSVMFPLNAGVDWQSGSTAQLLAHLLTQNSPGTLMNALRGYEYADGLTITLGFEDPNSPYLLLNFDMFHAGGRSYWEILRRLFVYADLIASSPMEQWRSDEYMLLQAQRWCRDAQDIEDIAEQYERSGAALALSESAGVGGLDAGKLSQLANAIRPENMLLVLADPDFSSFSSTPWFGAPYAFEKLADSDVEHFKADQETSARYYLKLPAANPFVAKAFHEDAVSTGDFLRRLKVRSGIEAWYGNAKDDRSSLATFNIMLRSSVLDESKRNAAQANLFVSLLNEQLTAMVATASDADAALSIDHVTNGIMLEFSGYPDSIERLLTKTLERISGFSVKPREFRGYQRGWEHWYDRREDDGAEDHASRVLAKLMQKPAYSYEDLISGIRDASYARLHAMLQDWRETMSVTTLAFGMIPEAKVRLWNEMISKHMDGDGRRAVFSPAVTRLRPGLQRLLLQTPYDDSYALLYIQGDQSQPSERAFFALTESLASSEFFSTLRTEAQLGYVVNTSRLDFGGVPGLRLAVQSPYVSADLLETHMLTFFHSFGGKLSSMDDARFKNYVDSLVDRLGRPASSAQTKAERVWFPIHSGAVGLDDRERQVETLKTLTLKQYIDWLHRRFITEAGMISILVEGQKHRVALNKSTRSSNIGSVEDFHAANPAMN
ncbi:insulinase family protein [Allohahella sp. A8]|uniref:insulinase family protein n=1 Tax=Allohahella sp. A8 TaxID=3141461 RepID=UPI003A80EEBD